MTAAHAYAATSASSGLGRTTVSDIELVTADQPNTAYDRMVAGDVKYRFVLDAGSLKELS